MTDFNPEHEQPAPQNQQQVSRRKAFGLGASAAAALIGWACSVKPDQNRRPPVETGPRYPDPPPQAPEAAVSKETLIPTPTEFGFNTHMYVSEKPGENHTLANFKEEVDLMSAHNQQWVRFNFLEDDVRLPGTEKTEWNDKISQYDEAIEYAKSKGLKIFFVTGMPGFAKDLPMDQYEIAAKECYQKLAERYKDKIDVWQIFNEPDVHSFRDYSSQDDLLLNPQKMNDLAHAVRTIAQTIKSVNPDIPTTVNMSRWVGNNVDPIKKGSFLFDKLGDSVDAITLDLYPDDNEQEIKKLPDYVEYFSKRYNKPIYIGELGLPTNGRFTADHQQKYVTKSLDALKGGKVKPKAVMLYELTDQTTAWNANENSFGYRDRNGIPKKSFNAVVEKMQKEKTPQNNP